MNRRWVWDAFMIGVPHGLVVWSAIQFPGRWWSFLMLVVTSGLNTMTLALRLDTRRMQAQVEAAEQRDRLLRAGSVVAKNAGGSSEPGGDR